MRTTLSDVFLLIDAGGTYLKGVAGDSGGNIIPGTHFSEPVSSDGDVPGIMSSFRKVISGVLSLSGGKAAAVGMTFPGPFDYNWGVSLMTHKFAALKNLDLGRMIRSIPEVGNVPVRFVHDVTCLVSGQMYCGAAKGFRNVAVVTLGTGLGFAEALDGKVLRTHAGSPSTSLWNSPYRGGILEDRISVRGITARYAALSGKTGVTVKEIAGYAREGDAAAVETFDETGAVLGEILASKAAEHSLECILFGGQISRSFDLFSASLSEKLSSAPSLRHVGTVSDIDNAAFQGILAELQMNRIP